MIIKAESETTMSGNERRRDGYERLTNNFERFLNQQRTVQERLSNNYQTAQERYRMTQNDCRIAIERLLIGLGMVTNNYPIDQYRKTKNGY